MRDTARMGLIFWRLGFEALVLRAIVDRVYFFLDLKGLPNRLYANLYFEIASRELIELLMVEVIPRDLFEFDKRQLLAALVEFNHLRATEPHWRTLETFSTQALHSSATDPKRDIWRIPENIESDVLVKLQQSNQGAPVEAASIPWTKACALFSVPKTTTQRWKLKDSDGTFSRQDNIVFVDKAKFEQKVLKWRSRKQQS
jgi:hypothetical protein